VTTIENKFRIQIFEYIRNYLQEHEHLSPTYREIADGCYMATSTMAQHLVHLEAREWIIREYNIPRSIRLGKNAPSEAQLEKIKAALEEKDSQK
jgi:SOS-response transcriptional repressor LexA